MRQSKRLCLVGFGAAVLAAAAVGQVPPQPSPDQADVEVLARGPVHEAFAAVVDGKLSPTPVVSQPRFHRSTNSCPTSNRPRTPPSGSAGTGTGRMGGPATCG